ncbi:hypothetical protein Godav_020589, partial [Gossypium davidsonii]|nr:hypothetical protein [Gossypium davidsonii]
MTPRPPIAMERGHRDGPRYGHCWGVRTPVEAQIAQREDSGPHCAAARAEEPVQKYYQRADAIFDSGITSDEVLSKAFEELGLSVEELLQQFESWQLILSKVY